MTHTDDRSGTGSPAESHFSLSTRNLPPPEVRELPPPPSKTWRIIGPGIVAAGVGLASGEFILYPFIASQVGRTLHLFDWTGVEPTGFFSITSPHVLDLYWNLDELYTTGKVSVWRTGDVDRDGNIDTLDLTILLTNWTGVMEPCADPSLAPLGDFDLDCDVDSLDLTLLLANWTGAIAALPPRVVPEPSTPVLLICGLLLIIVRLSSAVSGGRSRL